MIDELYYSYVVSTLDVLRKTLISQENNTVKLFTYLYNNESDIRNDINNISYNVNMNLNTIIEYSNLSNKIEKIEEKIVLLSKTQNSVVTNINKLNNSINILIDNLNKKEEKIEEPEIEDDIIEEIDNEKEIKKKINWKEKFYFIRSKINKVISIKKSIIDNILMNIYNNLFYLNLLLNREIQKIEEEKQQIIKDKQRKKEINKKIQQILNHK